MTTINLDNDLNPAQLEAVTTTSGPILVIAGAGSGKTRTVVYRLAHLVNMGLSPESILLLTFTRKAAQEMLSRASGLLGQGLHGVAGGTFHGFAFSILRRYGAAISLSGDMTILDRGDSEGVVKQVRDMNAIGKNDRSFPKKSTLLSLISKSRNKELDLGTLLEKEAGHLLPYTEDIVTLFDLYQGFKAEHGLLDYDDLLFSLERLLLEREDILDFLSLKHSHIMVDEFQDTNLVQGRIVKLLAGQSGNIMAVGDDAQSIYSFRGATVNNILSFPEMFPGTSIIKLEQNYRSAQPILTLSNKVLDGAREKYAKKLFSMEREGPLPQVLRPMSDLSQAQVVLDKILELSRTTPKHEIAVLFRAGFQSYNLEMALNRIGMGYRKYGGLKFTEAAHIKDVLAFLRLVHNYADLPAWQRVTSLLPGIGPKTCQKLYQSMQSDRSLILQQCAKKPELKTTLELIEALRMEQPPPMYALEKVFEHYQPYLQAAYPDDYPKRQVGLEQLAQIASAYQDLDVFLSELSLEHPDNLGGNEPPEDTLILSTVHSAKGLEWTAVIILDLVEDRFPSRHAQMDVEAMEEERRLFYVACTRAKEYLGLSVPETIHNRSQSRSDPAMVSPFVAELEPATFEELRERYSGTLAKAPSRPDPSRNETAGPDRQSAVPAQARCSHKIFGQGKVVRFMPPNRYEVNFPGFGLKVILGDYLRFEEN